MITAPWLQPLAAVLTGHPVLGRLAFTSIEFAALALGAGAILKGVRPRQPRLAALLWLVVMAKPLAGLIVGAPLPLFGLTLPSPAPLPVIATAPAMEPLPAMEFAPLEVAPVTAPPIDWAALAPRLVLWGWLAGAGLLALRLLLSAARLALLIRRAAAPPAWIAERLNELGREGGVRRLPRCLVTERLESPALAGFWRPVILLPAWLCAEGEPAHVEWSLRHELMHWRLRDPLASLVCELVKILFFFHPAAWWAGRRWQEATELACDRALIQSAEEAEVYVQELYRMLLKVRDRRRLPLAGGLFAGRTQISRRIESLLRDPLRSPARLSAATVVFVVVFSLATLAVGVGIKKEMPAEPAKTEEVAVPALKSAESNVVTSATLGAGLIGMAKAAARGQVDDRIISATLPFGECRVTAVGVASSVKSCKMIIVGKGFFDVDDVDKFITSTQGPLSREELQRLGLQNLQENRLLVTAKKIYTQAGPHTVRLEGDVLILFALAGQKEMDLWSTDEAEIINPKGTPPTVEVKSTKPSPLPRSRMKVGAPGSDAHSLNLTDANGFPFAQMTAKSIAIDPKGTTRLSGKVRIESKDFNLNADRLDLDNKTKILHATGNPLKLDVNPGNPKNRIQAQGGQLTHDLNQGSFVLEDATALTPSHKVTADIIRIQLNSERGPGGEPPIVMKWEMRRGSTAAPRVEERAITPPPKPPKEQVAFEDIKIEPRDPAHPEAGYRLSDRLGKLEGEAKTITADPKKKRFILSGEAKLIREDDDGKKIQATTDRMIWEFPEKGQGPKIEFISNDRKHPPEIKILDWGKAGGATSATLPRASQPAPSATPAPGGAGAKGTARRPSFARMKYEDFKIAPLNPARPEDGSRLSDSQGKLLGEAKEIKADPKNKRFTLQGDAKVILEDLNGRKDQVSFDGIVVRIDDQTGQPAISFRSTMPGNRQPEIKNLDPGRKPSPVGVTSGTRAGISPLSPPEQ